MPLPDDDARCPCLSGLTFGECCGPILDGERPAPTAERLMRSRYSAFATENADYLLESWHPSTRPAELELDPRQRWYRLDIVKRERGRPLDLDGIVEFIAYFRFDGGADSLHERSRFRWEGGRWYYVDGAVLEA
ncbi:YchJ family protein [Agromyces archimandritae]|uniref:UPF0225 protein G127AT_05335 n=1 Tax=Agromyces archimandritae TaxID=2781962 RepID=A0A975IPT5_9MICO|nr:YchJ family protein [Agromyces archimandritae]QTX05629.1 YchJ family protein [Agromyces archimandritae]